MDGGVQGTLFPDHSPTAAPIAAEGAAPLAATIAPPVPAAASVPDAPVFQPDPPAPRRSAYASVVGATHAQPMVGPRTPTDDFDDVLERIEHWRYTAPTSEKVFVAVVAVLTFFFLYLLS
jgi:hypothetical protein